MIIRCPKCRTGYSVGRSQITAAGRMVRCSHCGHEWHQDLSPEKPQEMPEKVPLAPINIKLDDDISKAFYKKKTEENPKLKVMLLSVAFSVVFVLILLVLGQSFLSKAFPSLTGFYKSVGLASEEAKVSSATGLVVPKESVERALEDGEPLVLTFKGKLVNTNTVAVNVPKIMVTLHDDKGVEIDSWPAYPEKARLEAGEETRWVCRFFNPDIDRIYEHRIKLF